jgi:hypothetical protein
MKAAKRMFLGGWWNNLLNQRFNRRGAAQEEARALRPIRITGEKIEGRPILWTSD